MMQISKNAMWEEHTNWLLSQIKVSITSFLSRSRNYKLKRQHFLLLMKSPNVTEQKEDLLETIYTTQRIQWRVITHRSGICHHINI